MELVHWMFVVVGVVVAAATPWLVLAQHRRDWKPLTAQMAEQVTQSAALVQECASGFKRGH